MTILIVDDNDDSRTYLARMFKSQGYTVEIAENGSQALSKAMESPPDLIITDVLMPVMDGFELCRRCKINEQLRSIPLIFYSATYTDVRDQKLGLILGAERYIIKPQQPEVLAEVVHELLEACHKGTLASLKVPMAEEVEILRQYNEVLFCKLEDKMHQLEAVIVERKQVEKQIQVLNVELERRVVERTAQLQIANKDLEAYSYTISHDLGAPLRAIQGFSDILLSSCGQQLDEEKRGFLETICSQARRMALLMNDLLRFSQYGYGQISCVPLDMAALAQTAFEVNAPPIQRTKRIHFISKPMPPACGDLFMIEQVWINLLSNAIKYTSRKDVAEIEVGGEAQKNENIYYVKDNGAGFDMKYASKLFSVFQRLHNTSEFEGTGVGLAIVQRIIQRHGGRIWAEGKIDSGAIFTFTLPVSKEM